MENNTGTQKVSFALTFDDGPHAAGLGAGKNYTENILNTLEEKGLKGKAAFFIQTGVRYRGASTIGRQLVTRMFNDGYAIGIHTGGSDVHEHEAHTEAAKAGRLQREMTSAKTYIKGITGSEPLYVRAPYGKTNKAVLDIYKKLSLTHLYWDIDGDPDGSNITLDQLKSRFDSGLKALKRDDNGNYISQTVSSCIVVLFHDIRTGTSRHIGGLIDYIKTAVPGACFQNP